jgi:hypothetical protein
MIDKARVCSSQKEDLSIEHFIELIGKRVQDCEAWERKLRSQGKLKEAEKIRKSNVQMMKSLGELQRCQLLRKR